MMDKQKIYPRSKDRETVYLKNVITDPSIIVGDYTMYNDFVNDPVDVTGSEYWIYSYSYPSSPIKVEIISPSGVASAANAVQGMEKAIITASKRLRIFFIKYTPFVRAM